MKNFNDSSNPPLLKQLRQRIERDFLPRFHSEWGGKFIIHGRPAGPHAVRLDNNDYLSLSGHPDIVRAQVESLSRDDKVVIQSTVLLSEDHPAGAFEKSLSRWMGKEDGVLCQSGYMANVGLVQAIADRDTPVYVDTIAHASLWEGVHVARAPGHAIKHNDPEHLDKLMREHGAGLVIVDSIYSGTGALCPLRDIVEVTERHGGMLLVDESHSLGTRGPEGAGLCAELGLTDRVHFITASLSKVFAGRAGFFTIPASLRDYVLSVSFPGIFSSCLLPYEVAGLAATLELVRRADVARERLRAHTLRLRASLDALGYPIRQGTEQIIALEAGPEPDTIVLRDELEARDVYGAVFCAPSTGRKRSMIRLTLNAGLTDAQLLHVEEAAREIASRVRPWDWPAASRQRGVLSLSA